MIAKQFFISVLILCITASMTAQQNTWIGASLTYQLQPEKDAKTTYLSDSTELRYVANAQDLLMPGFSIFQTLSNGWFQAFAIVRIQATRQDHVQFKYQEDQKILQPTNGFESNLFSLALRWEYGRSWHNTNEAFISPALSLGIDPYAMHWRIVSKTALGFPANFTTLGANVSVIPSLTFRLASNVRLGVHAPVPFVGIAYHRDKIENPVLPLEDQIQNELAFSLFPIRYTQFRMSVFYQLFSKN